MKTEPHNHQWMWRAEHRDVVIKRYPFALLLGLSLASHLLVLVIWPALQPQQLHLALPSADFSIRLEHSEVKTASVSNAVSIPNSIPAPIPNLIRTKPTKARDVRQTITKPQVAAKAAQPEQAETARSEKIVTAVNRRPAEKPAARINRNRVVSRLQQELKQYFYYPRLAQRRNIQGTVILGFAINLQGTLTNIRIVKSSGFAILDMAAEDALQKLQQLDWDQDRDKRYLQRDNSNIKLPVIYKLTES